MMDEGLVVSAGMVANARGFGINRSQLRSLWICRGRIAKNIVRCRKDKGEKYTGFVLGRW